VALIRDWAEEGRGLALLPDHVVAESVRAGRLARVLGTCQTPSWPVYAVTARRSVPRLVSQLIAHVKARLAESPLAVRPAP
jgi:DNA-binding transcriptional LysR family regulator